MSQHIALSQKNIASCRMRPRSHWERKALRSAPILGTEQGSGTEPVSSVPNLSQKLHSLRERRALTGENAQCERSLKVFSVGRLAHQRRLHCSAALNAASVSLAGSAA